MIASNEGGLGGRQMDKENFRRAELAMLQAETPPTEPRRPDATWRVLSKRAGNCVAPSFGTWPLLCGFLEYVDAGTRRL